MTTQLWTVVSLLDNTYTKVEAIDAQNAVYQVYINLFGVNAAMKAEQLEGKDSFFMNNEERTHCLCAFYDNRPIMVNRQFI